MAGGWLKDAAKRYKCSCALSERRLGAVWGGWSRAGVLLVGHESMVTKPVMAWMSQSRIPRPAESPQGRKKRHDIWCRKPLTRKRRIHKYATGVSRQPDAGLPPRADDRKTSAPVDATRLCGWNSVR